MKALIAVSIIVAASSTVMAEKDSPSKKSPNLAFALELVCPLAGHAYAGDVGKRLAPGVTYVVGLLTIAQGIDDTDFFFGTSDGGGKIMVGMLIASAGKLWGMISAYKVAKARDEKISINIEPAAKGAIMLKLSVPLSRLEFKLRK